MRPDDSSARGSNLLLGDPAFDVRLAKRAADVGRVGVEAAAATVMYCAFRPSGAAPASRFCVMPPAEPPMVAMLPLHHGCCLIHAMVSTPS